MSVKSQATVSFAAAKDIKAIMPIYIMGTAPILTDRCPFIMSGEKQPKLTPEQKLAVSYYPMSSNGHPRYGFPASGVKSSAISAARFIPGMTMVKVRGMFFVLPGEDGLLELRSLDGSENKPVLDMQMVKLKTGESVPAISARFDNWWIKFEVMYFTSIAKAEEIAMLYEVAGECVGLGRRRPERSGLNTFGTFRFMTEEECIKLDSEYVA